MDLTLEKFGSVFIFKDNYFVFFGFSAEDGRLFAAMILDGKKTLLIQKMSDKYEARPHLPIKDSLSLCFVVLKTDEFIGRAAAFHRTGDNVDSTNQLSFLGKNLNEEDIKALKNIILTDKAMPKILVDIVKKIDNGK